MVKDLVIEVLIIEPAREEHIAKHAVTIDEVNEGTVVGFHQANKTSTITIRFQPEFLQTLRNKAVRQGVGPTTLARMWIMEKLQASNA